MNAADSYRARWLLPGDRPPIHGGVVTVQDSRIIAVKGDGAFDVDLGDVVLAPGFVNVHAHLDLSESPRLESPPSSFTAWLRSVIQHRFNRPPIQTETISAIAKDLKRRGTVLLGDVAQGNVEAKTIAAAVVGGVTFGEVLGHRPERWAPLFEELQPSIGRDVGARRIGVSPHAPYSTSAEVYRRASPHQRCTHWLESPDEVEFLLTGGGPMKRFLQEIDAWPQSAPNGPWFSDPWAELLGNPSGGLLVHANFTTPSDLEHALQLSHGTPLHIAYCPRTHAAFGFNEYPLEMFLDAGCIVGLGTDGLASNPDLDVFREAAFVAERFPQFADERLLRMLTLDGARCLDFEEQLGSIAPGKSAALVVLESPNQPADRFDWPRFFSAETKVHGRLDGGFRLGAAGAACEKDGGRPSAPA